jgi:hypothetical protein
MMRWRISMVAALALFAAAACDADLPTMAEDEAELTPPSFKVVQNDKVDWLWPPVLNTCTGEYMTIEGRMHIVVKQTYDSSGGMHFKGQWQTMGMKATTPSGMVCQVNGPHHDNFNARPNEHDFFSWPQTYTQTVQWLWICPGPHNDGKAFYKFHVTVDANGQAHAFAETLRSECLEPEAIPI